MGRFFLKFAVFLTIAVVAYNFFFGTEQEKAQSRAILGQAADVGRSGAEILAGEYKKFRAGKYDKALDNIGSLLKDAKTQGSEALSKVDKWENAHKKWQGKAEEFNERFESAVAGEKNVLAAEADKLAEEAERLEREGRELTKRLGG